MKDKYEDVWDVVCCHNQKGSCDGCSGNVAAYVMGTSAISGSKTSHSWIRMCPLIMGDDMMAEETGLTVYHELQHMTSAVYDHPTKAYAKKTMVELAIEDPVGARLNSASYTMYIADTGLSREDFTKFTRTSGANARTPDCFDKYGNCPDLAKDCCYNRMVGGGQLLQNACCAACTYKTE
jgi:hypothetical protein